MLCIKPGLAFQSCGTQILWCRLWGWIRGYLLSSSLLRHEDVLSVSKVTVGVLGPTAHAGLPLKVF